MHRGGGDFVTVTAIVNFEVVLQFLLMPCTCCQQHHFGLLGRSSRTQRYYYLEARCRIRTGVVTSGARCVLCLCADFAWCRSQRGMSPPVARAPPFPIALAYELVARRWRSCSADAAPSRRVRGRAILLTPPTKEVPICYLQSSRAERAESSKAGDLDWEGRKEMG